MLGFHRAIFEKQFLTILQQFREKGPNPSVLSESLGKLSANPGKITMGECHKIREKPGFLEKLPKNTPIIAGF